MNLRILRVVTLGIILFLLIILLSGCGAMIVKGSGNVVQQAFEVSGFDKVSMSIPAKLRIEQGNEESCSIKADDNILALFAVEVEGDFLKIRFAEQGPFSLRPSEDIEVDIKLRRIEEVNVSGAAEIFADDIQAEDFSINASGAAEAEILNLMANSLDISISGAGEFKVSGSVGSQVIKISGAGEYFAKDLKSNDCKIRISGSGEALVNVSENLDVHISGAGEIQYIGDPAISKEVSGLGTITKYID